MIGSLILLLIRIARIKDVEMGTAAIIDENIGQRGRALAARYMPKVRQVKNKAT